MPSDKFISLCSTEQVLNPYIYVVYDNADITSKVLNISQIEKDDTITSKNLVIEVENIDNEFDTFLSDDEALTKKLEIYLTFVGYTKYEANTISFHDNSPDNDTIEDSANGLGNFQVGQIITISGSGMNDGSYIITKVEDDCLTLHAIDELSDESAGSDIIIESELQALWMGYVEKAIEDINTGIISLYTKSVLSTAFQKEVIDADQLPPLDIVRYNYLALDLSRVNEKIISDIMWEILTIYGGLDDTQSSSNTDIDYDSFTAWATAVDNGGYDIYDIGVICHGETVGNVITKLALLTESQIWVGGDGKIKFKASTQTISGQTYTTSKLLSVEWDVSLDGRVNSQWVAWGYNLAYDSWQSGASGMYYDSRPYGPTDEKYIYQTEIEQDRMAFHNSTNSAGNWVDEKFLITAPPIRRFHIKTQLLGFIEDIGNEIILSGLYVTPPYDSIELHIEKILLNINDFTADIFGYYIWGIGELT